MSNHRCFVHLSFLRFIFISGLLIFLNACSSSNTSTTSSAASGSFTDVYNNTISSANCVQCHAPGQSVYTQGVLLDFTSQTTSYTTLTNGATVEGPVSKGTCGSVKIVNTTTPANSYLMAVLFQSYNTSNFGGESGCTPYSYSLHDYNISSAEQTSILAWITAGAPNN